MIDKEILRKQFTARLHQALDLRGIRLRGRGSDILKTLNAAKVKKTPQAVSKWLNAGAIPEVDSLTVIADWLNVRREWLEHGVLPVSNSELIDHEVNISCHTAAHAIPLLGWGDIRDWCNGSLVPTHDQFRFINCPASIPTRGFALQVESEAMTNPGIGKTYPMGSIIFIEPTSNAKNGDTVIALVGDLSTMKVYVQDVGKSYLKPINPQYPTLELTNDTKICGRIIGTFIPE